MEEWLRPKKREITKKKPQEEIDAEALAHPTPMNLELRKAAKQRLREKAEATLAMVQGEDTDATAGATDATGTPASKKPTTAKKPSRGGKKPRVKPDSESEAAALSSDAVSPDSEVDVHPPPAARGGGTQRRAARNKVSYVEEGAESDVSMA